MSGQLCKTGNITFSIIIIIIIMIIIIIIIIIIIFFFILPSVPSFPRAKNLC